MPGKKKPMSLEDAYRMYGNDVTKIPGWSGRGMDGKVKPKPKRKPKTKTKSKPRAKNK